MGCNRIRIVFFSTEDYFFTIARNLVVKCLRQFAHANRDYLLTYKLVYNRSHKAKKIGKCSADKLTNPDINSQRKVVTSDRPFNQAKTDAKVVPHCHSA